MPKTFLIAGAVNMVLCVGLGAFGAHGLKGRLSEHLLAVYQTGVQYHLLHAIGLLVVGLVMFQADHGSLFRWAGYLMLIGIVLFSGSLYVLALGGAKWFGVVTPFGGLAFIAAWSVFAVAVWRSF